MIINTMTVTVVIFDFISYHYHYYSIAAAPGHQLGPAVVLSGARGQPWGSPGRAGCMDFLCHAWVQGLVLGFRSLRFRGLEL